MRYALRAADLGSHAPAALGADKDRRVLVVNLRDVPCTPELSALLRQAVEIALGTPYGRALMQDKERTLHALDRLQGALAVPDPRRRQLAAH